MRILGIDFESTGLDPQKDCITEVGLVLWESETKQPVRISGFLVKQVSPISAEITALTGITSEMCANFGLSSVQALMAIQSLADQADYIVAHNAPFDRGFYEAECARQGKNPSAKPWIDTAVDMPKEAYALGKSRSLKYWACDHAFTYPAHRAVNDVLAMLEIFGRYDLDTIIKRAHTPNVQVRAVVSFDDRNLAKERSYYWRPEAKLWTRFLKEDEVDLEKSQAPFPVVVMEMN